MYVKADLKCVATFIKQKEKYAQKRFISFQKVIKPEFLILFIENQSSRIVKLTQYMGFGWIG